ncbi:MAG TPA: hypothetical protein VFM34_00180 [Moraxellaceae bacterium]|nr:hypothetical protein [Moraxellaceae bacterium]
MAKLYRVTAKLKYPGCYHTGYEFLIHAGNKADAIKTARRHAAYEGHTRQDGPLSYTAIETEE